MAHGSANCQLRPLPVGILYPVVPQGSPQIAVYSPAVSLRCPALRSRPKNRPSQTPSGTALYPLLLLLPLPLGAQGRGLPSRKFAHPVVCTSVILAPRSLDSAIRISHSTCHVSTLAPLTCLDTQHIISTPSYTHHITHHASHIVASLSLGESVSFQPMSACNEPQLARQDSVQCM
jgi:hypothetical protein